MHTPAVPFPPLPVNTARAARAAVHIENVYLRIGDQLNSPQAELGDQGSFFSFTLPAFDYEIHCLCKRGDCSQDGMSLGIVELGLEANDRKENQPLRLDKRFRRMHQRA